MNATFDAVSNQKGNNVSSLTWNHVLGSGQNRQVLVFASAEDTTAGDVSISSVTINGVNLTQRTTLSFTGVASDAGRTNSLQCWQILESSLPVAGTYSIVVTFAGSCEAATAGAISLINSKQAAPEATVTNTSTSAGGSLAVAGTLTTLTDNALLVASAAAQNSGTWTEGAGETERDDFTISGTGHSQNIATKVAATAGSQTMTETSSNGEKQGIIVTSIAYQQPVVEGGYIHIS